MRKWFYNQVAYLLIFLSNCSFGVVDFQTLQIGKVLLGARDTQENCPILVANLLEKLYALSMRKQQLFIEW